MSTLYVDVDDTLILWGGAGLMADEWEPNPKAFRAIGRHMFEFEETCIWSLGGGDYAWEMWHHERMAAWRAPIEAMLRGWQTASHYGFGFESKWSRIPRPGDVFIDDDPLPSFRSATIHPGDLL